MDDEKKIEVAEAPKEAEKKEEAKPVVPRMRQIIIETDGDNINIAKAEVSGKLEMVAIMQVIIDSIQISKR